MTRRTSTHCASLNDGASASATRWRNSMRCATRRMHWRAPLPHPGPALDGVPRMMPTVVAAATMTAVMVRAMTRRDDKHNNNNEGSGGGEETGATRTRCSVGWKRCARTSPRLRAALRRGNGRERAHGSPTGCVQVYVCTTSFARVALPRDATSVTMPASLCRHRSAARQQTARTKGDERGAALYRHASRIRVYSFSREPSPRRGARIFTATGSARPSRRAPSP